MASSVGSVSPVVVVFPTKACSYHTVLARSGEYGLQLALDNPPLIISSHIYEDAKAGSAALSVSGGAVDALVLAPDGSAELVSNCQDGQWDEGGVIYPQQSIRLTIFEP